MATLENQYVFINGSGPGRAHGGQRNRSQPEEWARSLDGGRDSWQRTGEIRLHQMKILISDLSDQQKWQTDMVQPNICKGSRARVWLPVTPVSGDIGGWSLWL